MLFPNQGQWSEEEYLALDTNRMVELVNGCLEVLPMPTPFHQAIVLFLYRILHAFVRAHSSGEVLVAPLPVRLWPQHLREPDVIYLKPGRIRNRKKPPNGADLVMEVVSEGDENRTRDLRIKRSEYAKARITEYWIIDPEKRRLIVLSLTDDGKYRVHGRFKPGQRATSVVLPNFAVDVAQVFAAGEGEKGNALNKA
jgi:Uma2 family endonuclease